MTLRTELIDPLLDARWRAAVERSAHGCVYHHPAWLRVLHQQYRYPLMACGVVNGEREIVAGLPLARVESRLTGKRLVALPFSDVCPPLIADHADGDAATALAHGVAALHSRLGIDVEVRESVLPLPDASRRPPFYHHTLALRPGAKAIEAGFASSVRRAIRRAAREGVSVRQATDGAALDAFYALHLLTRRRLGIPTQPKRFIDQLAGVFDQGLGFVLLAEWQDQPIAASVFLSFNGTVTYKYGASDREHQRKRPNNAVMAEAIKISCATGGQAFDFGRTDLEDEGLRAFKRSWGAEERELAYTRLSRRPRGQGRAGVPDVMRTVISRSPPIVGRLAGRVLYRHFG